MSAIEYNLAQLSEIYGKTECISRIVCNRTQLSAILRLVLFRAVLYICPDLCSSLLSYSAHKRKPGRYGKLRYDVATNRMTAA